MRKSGCKNTSEKAGGAVCCKVEESKAMSSPCEFGLNYFPLKATTGRKLL